MYRLEIKFLWEPVPDWAQLLKGAIEKNFMSIVAEPVTQLSDIRVWVEGCSYFVDLHERSLKGRVSPIKGTYDSGFSFHVVSTDLRIQIMDIMYILIK